MGSFSHSLIMEGIMLFQSWQYLFLLIAAVATVYYIQNINLKKIVILALSIFFYAYGAYGQTVLFLLVILSAYFIGIVVEKYKRKWLFTVFILLLFLPLLLYKYVPFIISQMLMLKGISYTVTVSLPIGISFYTFQAVGYVIDVYKGTAKAERNILNFACFISFFPQLVAGPIERCNNIMAQIQVLKKPSYEKTADGFRHIVLGLCLKLLVAETMASFVNPVYNSLTDKGGLAILLATLCFGIQIYCDFNGYTQIAIGSAKLMGVDLMQNFDHPYCAKSISDFWRRWHISLTSWFKDYVYIPLGGNRKGKFRTAFNSVITFLVSGIWHGANWTYALWGLFNGLSMAIEKNFLKKLSKNKVLTVCYGIFSVFLINIFWVFFRANSIEDAFLCCYRIFTDTIAQLMSLRSTSTIIQFVLRDNGWSTAKLLPLLISLVIYLWYEYGFGHNKKLENVLNSPKTYVRWITYGILILATLYFGGTLAQSEFVYFRF